LSQGYRDLDEYLDAHSLKRFVHSHPHKRQRTDLSPNDFKPIVFIRLNTSLGKPEPVWIKALLDSGASSSVVDKKFTKKLRVKKGEAVQWNTPGGVMTTNQRVKVQFTIPELQDDKLIEWNVHVKEDLNSFDMILGRDILQFLGIDILFSQERIEWQQATIPFKHYEATPEESYYIDDKDSIDGARVKKILDAKYEAADLKKICTSQSQLHVEQQQKLLSLLETYHHLFDGTLGKWQGTEVKLELKPDAEPYHARAYPIPKCHVDTLKDEVERLCKIGVLKKVNRSEWAAPTFIFLRRMELYVSFLTFGNSTKGLSGSLILFLIYRTCS